MPRTKLLWTCCVALTLAGCSDSGMSGSYDRKEASRRGEYLQFNKDGTFLVYSPHFGGLTGAYKLDGSTMTLSLQGADPFVKIGTYDKEKGLISFSDRPVFGTEGGETYVRRPSGASIWEAARKGDVEQVGAWLQHGADIEALEIGEGKRTPLCAASSLGRLAVVKLLLERGADPNARDGDGRSALNLAVAGTHPDVVEVLLKNGADVNTTCLVTAVCNLHEASGVRRVVELLISKGADVNANPGGRTTALQYAELFAKTYPAWQQIVDLLKRNGARE